MNKTNIGIGVLLCVILLATFTLDSPCKDVFSTADFARQTLNEYGFNHPLPSEWDGYMVQVKRNNAASRNHDFFRALDSDYLHMIIRHPDWDTNVQDISFVLFNPEEWNANADEVTGGDISKLPPIVYFNEKYVYSVDPYDYKASKEKYDEIIEILFKFSYDTKQLDYKESFLVTIESDYIIYNEQSDQLSFTWRNILRDDVNAIGSYTIEKEVNSEWQVYYKGKIDGLNIRDHQVMYPVKPLELGHYRMAVDYERLTLFGLELNHKDLYRTFTEFNVGEKEVKRDENILEGIGLETEYEVYPEDTLVIKCKWYNTIQDDFTYGSTFALEKYENNIWVNVDFGEIGFTSEGYMLGPNEEPWQTFNMSWILDSLEQGKYRIKTDVLRDTLDGADFGPGNYPSYDIYSPFEIGDEKIKRNMTQLDDAYFYRNETYGFILKLDEDWKEPNIVELSNYSDLSTHDLYKALDPAYKILEIKHPSTNQSIKMIGFYRELWNKNARDATDGDLDLLPNILFSGPDMIFSTDKDLFDHSGDYIKSYNFIKTMKRY